MYLMGLDLGQARDYTALTVLDGYDEPTGRVDLRGRPVTTRYYHARHIERFPLGTPYAGIVTRVASVYKALQSCVIVADATGVGKPVVEMLWGENLQTIPVLITGGQQASVVPSSGQWARHVPKRDLVTAVQVLLQAKRLRVAGALPEARTLVQELLAFQVKINDKAHDQYGTWREGQHDDLVLALALAAWFALDYYGPLN